MNNIKVRFCGLDCMTIRCNGYDDIMGLLKLINEGGVISLSKVLESLDLRTDVFDDMIELSSDNYYIVMPVDMYGFKIITFNNVSDNDGFTYRVVLPEFKPVVTPDIKIRETKV